MQFQLTLDEQETNLVLAALAKLPLENVLDLWMKIRTQANQQVVAAQQARTQPEAATEGAPPDAA